MQSVVFLLVRMGKVHKLQVYTGLVICFFFLYSVSFFLYSGQSVSTEENIVWVDDDFPYPDESTGSLEKPYQA